MTPAATYRVELVIDAEQDLDELCGYLAANDSHVAAQAILDKLLEACASLSHLPQRGHHPTELAHLGIHTYREIRMGPHRIIYEIGSADVSIHAILDSRRNLQDLLLERLIR